MLRIFSIIITIAFPCLISASELYKNDIHDRLLALPIDFELYYTVTFPEKTLKERELLPGIAENYAQKIIKSGNSYQLIKYDLSGEKSQITDKISFDGVNFYYYRSKSKSLIVSSKKRKIGSVIDVALLKSPLFYHVQLSKADHKPAVHPFNGNKGFRVGKYFCEYHEGSELLKLTHSGGEISIKKHINILSKYGEKLDKVSSYFSHKIDTKSFDLIDGKKYSDPFFKISAADAKRVIDLNLNSLIEK